MKFIQGLEHFYEPICWDNLAKALEKYTQRHYYQYLEAPWIVSSETTKITFPQTEIKFSTSKGDLVGSGEQSFLQIRDTLKHGRYCTITPCFREDAIDEWHQHYFMKLELIQVGNISQDELWKTIHSATDVFESIGGKNDYKVVETFEGYDIELNGIELGSYGIRAHNDFEWIYGTGIAEPRFSKALRFLQS